MGLPEFLGMTRAEMQSGYVRNERVSMPVCQECGAVVAYESQSRHTAWHDDATRARHTG